MRENLKISEVYNNSTSSEKERVKIIVIEDTNLEDYALVDNTFTTSGKISNIHPHFFKFPNQEVKKNDIVIVHTGEDPKTRAPIKLINEPNTYRYYCGSGNSFWNDTGDTARLFRLALEDSKIVPNIDSPKKTFALSR